LASGLRRKGYKIMVMGSDLRYGIGFPHHVMEGDNIGRRIETSIDENNVLTDS
jgi:hypothetical protein